MPRPSRIRYRPRPPGRSGARSRSRRARLYGWLAAAAVGFAVGLFVGLRLGPAGAPPGEPRVADSSSPGAVPPGKAPRESRAVGADAAPPPVAYPPANGARVALVIDDLGRSVEAVDRLAGLGVPVAGAVLPFEPQSTAVARRLASAGVEVLCHLPMEGQQGADPGPGALTLEMGRRRLARATREALTEVPGAVGVNNHMGSALSASSEGMRAILEVVAEEGLFYLDSRTGADSVGYRLALELGIPAAERQVFLDVERRPEAVRAQFAELLTAARERGAAIAIGHPDPTTLGVLAEELPRALAAGYEFVPVSFLLDRAGVLPR